MNFNFVKPSIFKEQLKSLFEIFNLFMDFSFSWYSILINYTSNFFVFLSQLLSIFFALLNIFKVTKFSSHNSNIFKNIALKHYFFKQLKILYVFFCKSSINHK